MILKNKKLGYRFLRQKLLGNYIVDFYCAKLGLIIEIDGESHDYKINLDKLREKYGRKLGLEILRYTNAQVLKNLDGVRDDLEHRLSTKDFKQ